MLQEVEMKIKDMKCSGCEGTVRKKLLTVNGVYEARANFKNGVVLLSVASSFQSAEALKAIRDLGYTPVQPNE